MKGELVLVRHYIVYRIQSCPQWILNEWVWVLRASSLWHQTDVTSSVSLGWMFKMTTWEKSSHIARSGETCTQSMYLIAYSCEKNFSHREKARNIFSQWENCEKWRKFSYIGRRQENGEKWEKMVRKLWEMKKISHSKKAPAWPTATHITQQSCRRMCTFIL